MSSSAKEELSYGGPAILSYGFRPFFLAGSLWAAITLALWLPMLHGQLNLPSALAPSAWHAHELIYGYVPAVVAGFLLTAIPNWTGRAPVAGTPLLILFLFWLAGRLAIVCSLYVGSEVAAIVDLSFLAVLLIVVARELIVGNNLKNLKVLVVVAVLFAGNLVFHIEAYRQSSGGYGVRTGLAATILLIMIIGGRITPNFTRNWLAKQNPGRLPVSFNWFDIAILGISGLSLATWIGAPDGTNTALLFVLAFVLNVVRLSRWAGERTTSEPLVLILHVAYAFIPVGFALVSLSVWRPDILNSAGALHAWTAGAIALMTLAVMTRASLGHTGRQLAATRPIQLIYATALVAAFARLAASFDLWREPLLHIAAVAWISSFCGFVVVFGPMLARR